MPVTAGPIYPGVKDKLAFAIDFANRECYPQTGTIVTDLKHNTISGSLQNGPEWSSESEGLLNFDGVAGDRVILDNLIPKLDLTQGSISLWFKAIPGGGWDYLVSGGNSGVAWNANHFHISYNFSTQKIGFFGYGSSTSTDDTLGSFSQNTIHNLIVTSDGTAYKNGSPLTTDLSSWWFNQINTFNHFRIGVLTMNGSVYGGQFFKGNVYSLCIYNKALSAGEALTNYNRLKGRFGIS